MNWKTWAPLVLAITLGLIAAKIGRDMIVRSRAQAQPKDKLSQVVVVKRSVTPGQELTATDLATSKLATPTVPEGMFADVADVAGRVAVVAMVKDQPVTEALLAPKGSGSGIQALVPQGMRAITIEVNEYSGLAGLILPGCHVDVVASVPDEHGQGMLARTIVQNVKVTAVGQRMTVPAKSAADEKEGDGQQQQTQMVRSITLLVSPKEAEAIELASNSSRPRLVLRGSGDAAATASPGVRMAELRGAVLSQTPAQPVMPRAISLKPEPASRPVAASQQRTVQVIRGGVESQVTFEIRSPRDLTPPAISGAALEPAWPEAQPAGR